MGGVLSAKKIIAVKGNNINMKTFQHEDEARQMIELYAGYEIEKSCAKQAIVDFAINQMVARDLAQRGLGEDSIISRERIEDGVEVEHTAAGHKITNLRYCDKIIIPGDE